MQVKHKITIIVTAILSVLSFILISSNNTSTSALTYQSATDVNFTINPTISVSLSGDLVIDNLTPGNYSDSNIITVSVATNASQGYYLSATAGSSTTNTNLTHANGTNVFTSLSTNKSTLSSFDDNYWGYSYSTDNGTNWISGSVGSTNTGYNGLPLDGNDQGATGITIADATSPLADNSIKFKIGAKASNAQASGAYTNTVNFYAVTYAQPLIMQNLASAECTTSPTIAVDSRDGTAYTIKRLADGNCWMLDNLALDLTDPDIQATMYNRYNTQTNASYESIGYLIGANTRNPSTDPSGKYATAGVSSNWNSSYSYSAPLINMGSKDVVPQGGDPMAAEAQAGQWKVGGYYNYCAASAGSYCYGNGTSYGTSVGDAEEDICPAGWRMPTGNTSGEFSALANIIYGSTGSTTNTTAITNYRAALHLPLSGYFSRDSDYERNGSGYWWSSTRHDSFIMYSPSVGVIGTGPAGTNGRARGLSVRCIMKTYMQDLNSSNIATLLPNAGDTATVYDNRDEQKYTIAKLADGKYWMTENLNLAGGTALSSADTDVSSEYIANFSTSGNLTKSGNTIVLPTSSASGFNNNNYSYVYNTGNKSTNCASPGCYSYYSWDAATLGSGRNISINNTDAPYSVCPKGWHLPTTHSGTDSTTDFRALVIGYGGSNTIQTYNDDTSPTGATIYGVIGPGTTPNFLRTGYYYGSTFYDGGSGGYYWSSTSSSSAGARDLVFASGYVYSADSHYRRSGFTVRCLLNS